MPKIIGMVLLAYLHEESRSCSSNSGGSVELVLGDANDCDLLFF